MISRFVRHGTDEASRYTSSQPLTSLAGYGPFCSQIHAISTGGRGGGGGSVILAWLAVLFRATRCFKRGLRRGWGGGGRSVILAWLAVLFRATRCFQKRVKAGVGGGGRSVILAWLAVLFRATRCLHRGCVGVYLLGCSLVFEFSQDIGPSVIQLHGFRIV